jgi:hypothetical protein
VQELMGHRTIVTTMRYAHLSPDHQKDSVEILATEYGPKAATLESINAGRVVKGESPERGRLAVNSGTQMAPEGVD